MKPDPLDERDPELRASGLTTSQEVTQQEAQALTEPINPQLPDERVRKFNTPGFSRMRLDFDGPERMQMKLVHDTVTRRVKAEFADAYALMFKLWQVVREEELVEGKLTWRTGEDGQPIEDWSKLNLRQMERFIFQFTTRQFAWGQRREEAWAEAMFGKVTWEQAFSMAYENLPPKAKDTIEGRTARAKTLAKEDHFLALYLTYYSRKVDALVRSLEGIGQRLKDVFVASGGR